MAQRAYIWPSKTVTAQQQPFLALTDSVAVFTMLLATSSEQKGTSSRLWAYTRLGLICKKSSRKERFQVHISCTNKDVYSIVWENCQQHGKELTIVVKNLPC